MKFFFFKFFRNTWFHFYLFVLKSLIISLKSKFIFANIPFRPNWNMINDKKLLLYLNERLCSDWSSICPDLLIDKYSSNHYLSIFLSGHTGGIQIMLSLGRKYHYWITIGDPFLIADTRYHFIGDPKCSQLFSFEGSIF